MVMAGGVAILVGAVSILRFNRGCTKSEQKVSTGPRAKLIRRKQPTWDGEPLQLQTFVPRWGAKAAQPRPRHAPVASMPPYLDLISKNALAKVESSEHPMKTCK